VFVVSPGFCFDFVASKHARTKQKKKRKCGKTQTNKKLSRKVLSLLCAKDKVKQGRNNNAA